jgi:heme exporter protein D
MAAFFAMGGYAAYVWPAYGASVLVLGVAIALCVREHARAQAEIRRLENG